MNRLELIEHIAVGADISPATAEQVLNSIMDTIIEVVAMGDVVQLIGFGSFSQIKRTARLGRNPMTGESVEIPASISIKFRPGTPFKVAVNRSN